jgi:hypothetical protein
LKRWHLTLILALLAAVGVALAGGVPVLTAEDPEVLPLQTRPERQPQSTIPELEERLPPPPVSLPPDPVPPLHIDPCPGCGMG